MTPLVVTLLTVMCLACVAGAVVAMRSFFQSNPLAKAAADLSPDYEHPTPRQIEGIDGRYRLSVPPNFWVRTRAAARSINPLADRWITRPDEDSHILIIAEKIRPDQVMDETRMMDGLVNHLREGSRTLREVRRGTLPGHADVPFVEVETTLNTLPNLPLNYMIAVYMDGAQVLQLNGFYPRAAPASVRDELIGVMQRFTPLPMEGLPGNEGGAGGQPHLTEVAGGVLQGREFPYTLRVPAGWYLRNREEARVDLAEVDQWLMVPYEGTQLFVVGERLEAGQQLDLDRYAEILREQLSQNVTGFHFIEKTPFRAGPHEGFLMRYEAVVDGRPITYLMFATAHGELVFRVTAACSTPRLARREPVMTTLLQSFRVAPSPAP